MGDVYAAAFYHLVWATKNRAPLLVPEIELLVLDKLRRKCEEMGATVYALNSMPDHVHLACAIPPTIAVSEFVQQLKGSTSRFINHLDEPSKEQLCLYWQRGYGFHTFARRDLESVVRYIHDQKQRHQMQRLWPHLEQAHGDAEK